MTQITIAISQQKLWLHQGDTVYLEFPVSTAANGPGEFQGSECTPRGWHYIRAKIGDGCDRNTVFKGRRALDLTYQPELETKYPGRDWIITRIMWLCGLEPGKNRGGQVDTMRRYVYIHGTPDDRVQNGYSSRGCIGMTADDIMELYQATPAYTKVLIEE